MMEWNAVIHFVQWSTCLGSTGAVSSRHHLVLALGLLNLYGVVEHLSRKLLSSLLTMSRKLRRWAATEHVLEPVLHTLPAM